MCGIVGAVMFQEQGSAVADALATAIQGISHRGPDDNGTFIDKACALGHTRLSVIDTSTEGHQPMTDPTGRYTIVYNGEVYNYKEIKKEIGLGDEHYTSATDTEVVLQAFLKWGPEALPRLNGFFSLAIYDAQTGHLFLARDRFGIKPLVYASLEDRFIFGSELRSLFDLGLRRELDHVSLHYFLQLSYLPPHRSMVKGVAKLPPAHYAWVKDNSITLERYYALPEKAAENNRSLEELLESAVRQRLVSDVPLGTFLSGGIDSAIITGLASRHKPGIKSFTISFPGNKLHDESSLAEKTAAHFRTDHTTIPLGEDTYLDHMDRMLDHLDEPLADPAMIAHFVLSEVVSKEVTVALSGDGADEVFGGYNKHKAELMAMNGAALGLAGLAAPLLKLFSGDRETATANKIRQAQRFADAAKLPPKDRYWAWATFASEQVVAELERNEPDTSYRAEKDRLLAAISGKDLNEVLRTDIELVLAGNMLPKVDQMSMAHNLEVRVPFLDHHVVDLAATMPSAMKRTSKGGKQVLRDIFGPMLPPEILSAKKHGFDVPLMDWFKGPMNDRIASEYMNADRIGEQGIFQVDAVNTLRDRINSAHPGDIEYLSWSFIVFQHWYNRFMA